MRTIGLAVAAISVLACGETATPCPEEEPVVESGELSVAVSFPDALADSFVSDTNEPIPEGTSALAAHPDWRFRVLVTAELIGAAKEKGLVGALRSRVRVVAPAGSSAKLEETVALDLVERDEWRFQGIATLNGAGLGLLQVEAEVAGVRNYGHGLIVPRAPVELEIIRRAHLPPSGSEVAIRFKATRKADAPEGGAAVPVKGLELAVTLLPEVKFLPSAPRTDDNGEATVRFIVPKDVATMVVSVQAADAAARTVTLSAE